MSQFYIPKTLQHSLAWVGAAFLAYSTYAWGKFAYDFVRPSRIHLYQSQSASTDKNGNWALVTGASDGIGLGFTKELLERGFDVLLHGRNEAKLQNHRSALSAQWPGRRVEIVVADASTYDDGYARVTAAVAALPGALRVLVNNVGGIMTAPFYIAHDGIPHANIDDVLNINVRFMTHLTREMLPVLRGSAGDGTRARALVVNIGSIAGIVGVPYIATYSGTKGFVHAFTEALRHEVVAGGWEGVDVCGFVVGNVASNTNTQGMPFTITARECAASCLDKAGENGEAMLWAHWKHLLPYWFMGALPLGLMRRMLKGEMMKRVDEDKKGI